MTCYGRGYAIRIKLPIVDFVFPLKGSICYTHLLFKPLSFIAEIYSIYSADQRGFYLNHRSASIFDEMFLSTKPSCFNGLSFCNENISYYICTLIYDTESIAVI